MKVPSAMATSERRYFRSLDGLRGLCSLLVLCDHWKTLYPQSAGWLQQTGGEPVCVLFCLSGFFMAYLYAARPFGTDAVQTYLVHRFARIYPAYLFAVLLMAFLSHFPQLGIAGAIESPVQTVRLLMLVGSAGVFWSITPEIQFYLFFVLVWLFAARPERYHWLGIAILTFVAADVMLDLPGPGTMLPSKLPYFMLGVVAGYIYHRGYGARPSKATDIATLTLLAVYLMRHVLYPRGEVVWSLESATGAAILVFLAASDTPVASAVLASPPLRFIGKISFSLFLFHVPVFMLVHEALDGRVSTLWQTLACWAAVFATALASFTFLEKPGRSGINGWWQRHRSVARGAAPSLRVPG